MPDRSIAWMMSGGARYETVEERLDRIHAQALREARAHVRQQPTRATSTSSLRTALVTALAAVGIGSTTTDCCVA